MAATGIALDPRRVRSRRCFHALLALALAAHLGRGLREALAPDGGSPPELLRVDLARDGVTRLACLPGLGPARAHAIALARGQWSTTPTVQDLLAVEGIGPHTVHLLATTPEAEVWLAGRPLAIDGGTMDR